MAIAFVYSGTSSGTSSPIQFPSSNITNLAAGDILIAQVKVSRLTGVPTITPPAGWEQLYQGAVGDNTAALSEAAG